MYPKGELPPAVRRQREPRFVPYEPYKAAVAFLEGGRKPPLLGRSRGGSVEEGWRSTSAEEAPRWRGTSVESREEVVEEVGEEASPLVANYRAMLEAKEEELAGLQARCEAAERHLKIQTKVNVEVKRLLVASVGEDIQARVDFLTQDKARLAADVVQYNNRLAVDWEEIEALGVESGVWKSKFLASSVIVGELEKVRAEARSRGEALEMAARRLLGERSSLRSTIAATQQVRRICLDFHFGFVFISQCDGAAAGVGRPDHCLRPPELWEGGVFGRPAAGSLRPAEQRRGPVHPAGGGPGHGGPGRPCLRPTAALVTPGTSPESG